MSNKWRLLILISSLWLIAGIGLCIHAYYTTPSSVGSRLIEASKFFLLMLGGLGVVIPAHINIYNIIEAHQIDTARLDYEKTNNAFNLCAKWDDTSFLRARTMTRDINDDRNKYSPNELVELINGNKELKESVIHVLNYFEDIRLSIKYDRANANLIYDSMRSVYLEAYRSFLPWIERSYPPESQNDLLDLHNFFTFGTVTWSRIINIGK